MSQSFNPFEHHHDHYHDDDDLASEPMISPQLVKKSNYGVTLEQVGIKKLVLPQNSTTKVFERMKAVRKKASRLEKIVASVEGFFDAGDAVKRRKTANKIYKDLVAERISAENAALKLQALNKRQKGGWLQERLFLAQRAIVRRVRSFLMRRVK